jgi:hypothetical protein
VANAVTNVTGTFDGIDDVVADTSAPALLSNNYTFEAWVNRKAQLFLEEFLINQE